jgi:hypothetical protein
MYSFLGTHKVSRVYTVHLIINIGISDTLLPCVLYKEAVATNGPSGNQKLFLRFNVAEKSVSLFMVLFTLALGYSAKNSWKKLTYVISAVRAIRIPG